MRIDIIARDGSPLGVTEKTINGEDGRMGCGGAELAIMTLMRGWAERGDDVTFYNNPTIGGASIFKQKTQNEFDPGEDRDVLIVFRSPNPRVVGAKGLKVWLSTDQYTIDDFKSFSQQVDRIVCISPHHQKYFESFYGITNTVFIDLPVRIWEYDFETAKIPNRCIFTSIPDRGLMCLHAAWPLIVREVPDASLEITSDWRLWTENADMNAVMTYRLAFSQLPNVIYHGAVKRPELVKIQKQAQLHLYPCTYEELFCISVAESQVAGAYPVTSTTGALAATNMGTKISGSPTTPEWVSEFVRITVDMLKNPQMMKTNQDFVEYEARKRFSLDNILSQWDKVFNVA